jgi:DNA modification methylase
MDARGLEQFIREHVESPDGFVDAVITSPPYADLKDYGGEGQIGQQPYQDFIDDLRNVMSQCYRVSADDATLWTITDVFKRNGRVVRLPDDLADVAENLYPEDINLGIEEDESDEIPRDCVEICPNCGSYLRQVREFGTLECAKCGWERDPLENSWRMVDYIIWDKKRTLPWADQKLRNIHEHITVFGKSDNFKYDIDDVRINDPDELTKWWVGYPERYSPEGKIPTNIWDYPIPKQGQWGPKLSVHPSPFPLGLVERMIRMSTDEGDVVLDPFAGVGTTLAVAEALGRKAIGFELNEEYEDAYENYIRESVEDRFDGKIETQQTTMERKIWILRIHKYAVRIYDELSEIIDVETPHQAGVTSVFTLFDPETIPPDRDQSPEGEVIFALSGGSPIEGDEQISEAAQAIRSGGSGGYYGLQGVDLRVMLAGEFAGKVGDSEESSLLNSDLHTYIGGHHHWCVGEMTPIQWVREYGTQPWRQAYFTNDYPPVLSNLHIQQRDETRSNPPELADVGQSSVLDFGGTDQGSPETTD